jgi:hypothetical protein
MLRERHAVAGVEGRQEGQRKAAGGAGGHDDLLGRDLRIVGLAIVPRDALAQRRHAECGHVADAIGIERGVRGRQRALGCGRAGLPDLEMDHGVAGRFLLGGGRHHVHDDERIDRFGAARDLGGHAGGPQRGWVMRASPDPALSMPVLQLPP